MRKFLVFMTLTLLFVSCGSNQSDLETNRPPDPCTVVPDDVPKVMCSGDSIEWDCNLQNAYVNGKLSFHYSDDGCVNAIITQGPGGNPTGTHTEITPDQIRQGIGLEKDEQRE